MLASFHAWYLTGQRLAVCSIKNVQSCQIGRLPFFDVAVLATLQLLPGLKWTRIDFGYFEAEDLAWRHVQKQPSSSSCISCTHLWTLSWLKDSCCYLQCVFAWLYECVCAMFVSTPGTFLLSPSAPVCVRTDYIVQCTCYRITSHHSTSTVYM